MNGRKGKEGRVGGVGVERWTDKGKNVNLSSIFWCTGVRIFDISK